MVSSMAEEVRSTSTASLNRTCSNRRSRENKCSNGAPSTKSRGSSMKLICNRGG